MRKRLQALGGHVPVDAWDDVRPGEPALGLPIGALTSQHLANAYLDSGDRLLLGLPEVLGACALHGRHGLVVRQS